MKKTTKPAQTFDNLNLVVDESDSNKESSDVISLDPHTHHYIERQHVNTALSQE